MALLLARQGVEVMLLEAHQDFDRDFRGDTVHPSTLEMLDELGLLKRLLELPHARVSDFPFHFPDGRVSPPGCNRLRSRHPDSYQIPQTQFLDLLVSEARQFPSFHLVMGARVDQLIQGTASVCGVRYTAPDGPHEVRAALVVGADGRFSKVRQLADIPLKDTAEPMDVLWLRLPRRPTDPERAHGIYMGGDGLLVVMDRGDAWQVGYVFAKGAYQRLRAAGLEVLRESIGEYAPWLGDRTEHLQDWRQTSLLSVAAGRVQQWYRPGLLLVGDAAHVMSPVAGVGINYAIQDAIVASNLLGQRLRQGALRTQDLAAVQRRREFPTRLMQFLQRGMRPRFESSGKASAVHPLAAWLIDLPPVAELRARLIGFGGWQPERVRPIALDAIPGVQTPLHKRLANAAWSALSLIDAHYLAVYGIAWWPPTVYEHEYEAQ
jgi:2-polyprenyl-6-methoxyphenol hydroxylase-like FAD-dependent oxidoreductase